MSTHRGGSGTPLVLIHGFTSNWRCWKPVIPALEEHHDVAAITLAGHYEGAPLPQGTEVSVDALVDAAERELDALGIERAHLVGNSLGGWVALGLGARRRGLSVVALAPAGGWVRGGREERRLKRYFLQQDTMLRLLSGSIERLVLRPRFRALAFRDVAVRPASLPPGLAVELARASSHCDLSREFIESVQTRGFPEGLDEIDCPVRIAWGTEDRIISVERHSGRFRDLVPEAEWVELEGIGHVPMLDDPPRVVRVVRDVTARVDGGERREAAGAAAS